MKNNTMITDFYELTMVQTYFEQGKKADFDACSQAVGKVYHVFLEQFLKKCRTTSDEEKREELLENMKRFLAWHPNGQENSLSYVQAVDLYNNMARMSSRQRIRERSLKELLGYQIWKETPNVREEYRVWLQAVADRIRNIHEVEDVLVQLEKRRKDICRYCSMDCICQVLYCMLELCRGHDGLLRAGDALGRQRRGREHTRLRRFRPCGTPAAQVKRLRRPAAGGLSGKRHQQAISGRFWGITSLTGEHNSAMISSVRGNDGGCARKAPLHRESAQGWKAFHAADRAGPLRSPRAEV